MCSLSIVLRSKVQKVLMTTVVLVAFLSGSATATAASSKPIRYATLHKVDPNKPASKLEVITAVKKKFKGRIISVRKRYEAYGSDCHYVKFIDREDGELFLIQVGCKK